MPDKAEMFELRLVPERTLSDLELGCVGVFAWNDQATGREELRQYFNTMLVDGSPVHSAVFCDTGANEFVLFFVPFLLRLATQICDNVILLATDPSELEPLLV